jgi:hypothetical protein
VNIFISGGIGDFIALESHFSDEMRSELKTVYLASRANKEIAELINAVYPNVKCEIVWSDFTKFPCFFSIDDFKLAGGSISDDVEDWSIMAKFNLGEITRMSIPGQSPLEILHEFQRKNKLLSEYNGSSFLKNRLCNLPEKLDCYNDFIRRWSNRSRDTLLNDYVVIFPYTGTPTTSAGRNFNDIDWKYVKTVNKKAIVLGNLFNQPIPPLAFNVKTTIPESIEILKGASGYIGIDSFLSVLAAKLFEYPNLKVKSINPHCYNAKHIYYAPQTNFEFLKESIC